MKLISFAVPSYNSQDYLSHCIDTLLTGGEEVEILIVNDGSKDNTAAIADEYQAKYPTIVRAIHKENGGHGSGVNAGLKNATGLYYKVVDSDDWLDAEALKKLLATIRSHVEAGESADLYLCNFVYEHVNDNTAYLSEYTKNFPVEQFFTWKDMKPLHLWKMLLMHTLIYRTEAVRASGIVLPEHTFYVDNVFAFQPLPYMKKLYYLNVDLYRYYIGRSDQSVNVENVVKRYDQQVRVMRMMLEAYTYDELFAMDKQLRKLMVHCLTVIMVNTTFFTTAQDSPERRAAYNGMWNDLKTRDKKLYSYLRYHTYLFWILWMPWKMKGAVTTWGYKFLCKHVKLG